MSTSSVRLTELEDQTQNFTLEWVKHL